MSGTGALTSYADATGLGVSTPPPWVLANVIRTAEVTPAKAETDIGSTYTVAAGKAFALTAFVANINEQNPTIVRVKKQVGGAGAWTTVARITLKMHGQDPSDVDRNLSGGIVLGTAGDVFKLTQESALAKGSLWAAFAGVEY